MEFSTGNFDLSVQLNERFLKSVLAAAYFTGRLPDFLEGQVNIPFVGEATWTLYLDPPTLDLLPTESGQPVRVRFSQSLILRLSNQDNESNGECSFVVPILLDTRTVDGANAQFLRLDLTQVPDKDVTFKLMPPNPLMEAVGRAELMSQLRKLSLDLPITPLVGGKVFLAFSVSADPTQQMPAFSSIERNYLSLFINLDGQSMEPPAAHPPQLGFSNFTKKRDEECAVAIPEAAFMPPLRDAVAKAGLVNGQVIPGTEKLELKEDLTDITFPYHVVLSKDVTLELKDGFLRFGTGVTAVIEGLPNVSADVSAELMFGLGENKLLVTTRNVDSMIDIDVSFIEQVVLGLVTGMLSLIIEQVLEEELESVLEGQFEGKTIPVPLPQKTIFRSGIAVTTGAAVPNVPSLVVRNSVLQIFPQGIIIRSLLDLVYEKAPRHFAPYVRAHRLSKEFHKESCPWGRLIGQKNLVLFVRPEAALKEGYDGCNFCYPEFNGLTAPGTLVVYFWKPGFAPHTLHTEEVTWKCDFLSGTVKSGTSEPQVRTKSEEDTTNEFGQYVTYENFSGLRPGKWKVTVSNADWSTQATLNVRGDRAQAYRFTYGVKKPKKA